MQRRKRTDGFKKFKWMNKQESSRQNFKNLHTFLISEAKAANKSSTCSIVDVSLMIPPCPA